MIAILSDIHANLAAMQAVFEEVDELGIGTIYLAGDLVGYGASPEACVRMAMERKVISVLGNHDVYTLELRNARADQMRWRGGNDGMSAGIRHAAMELSEEAASWLASQPYFAKPEAAILVHASLDEPEVWNYIESADDAEYTIQIVRGRKRHVVFTGHTHIQRIFADTKDAKKIDEIEKGIFRIPEGLATVVTVGSIGRPDEPDNDMRARWVLWDPVERVVEFRRTKYDIDAAVAAIRAAGLPEETAKALY